MDFSDENQPNSSQGEVTNLKDVLLGLTALNQDTALLDYGNVVIRRNYDQLTTVRILSGAIAGSDLTYATLVGKGMLTAAVLTDEIAPESRLILRTIKELSQGVNSGIFVISRIGSPEMFNLSLAVQRCQSDCQMRVKLLTVDDNKFCKNPTCGVIMLSKIVGAMAEEGVFFDEIYKCYKEIANEIISVPLHYLNFEKKHIGARVSLSADFGKLFKRVIDKQSQNTLRLHPSIPIVALINTPKSLGQSAEAGLIKQVVERLRNIGVCVARLYLGNFVAVPHDGASLTVLNVSDNKFIKYLDAPCEALGWQPVTQTTEVTIRNEIPSILTNQGKQSIPLKGPKLTHLESDILVKSVQFACEALISCERQLNIIDAERSSGNIGSRLANFAAHMNKRLQENRIQIHVPYAFLKKSSVMAESAICGTLGAIYGLIFDTAARVFGDSPENEPITAETWAKALTAVEEAIRTDNNSRTMYFPIKMCSLAVQKYKELNVIERFGLGVSQAEEAAQRTVLPGHKYADAGAHAVGIWLRAVYEGVKLMYFEEIVTDTVK